MAANCNLCVGDLAALVLQEQGVTRSIGDNLSPVRQAVGHTTILDGLHQRGHRGLPLGTACAVLARDIFALGNSHSYLTISSNNNLVFGTRAKQPLQGRPARV